jgi:hypothetical protein
LTVVDQIVCPVCARSMPSARFEKLSHEGTCQMLRYHYGGRANIRVEVVGMQLGAAMKMHALLKNAIACLEADLTAAGVALES